MEDFDDFNNNIMDEDNALDYVLYEDMTKNEGKRTPQNNNQNSGCCVTLLMLGGAASSMAWGLTRLLS